MTAIGSVEILEGWLEHDTVGNDLKSEFLEGFDQGLLFLIVEDCMGFGVFQDGVAICFSVENGHDFRAEVCVTDEPLSKAVFADKLLNFLLCESKLKGTKARSELKPKEHYGG